MVNTSFGSWLIDLLARLGPRLPPLFPCSFVQNEEDGSSVYEVTLTGKALMVFWRFSGDQNTMHEPTKMGGVVQGLAMLAAVNEAVSMWAPGRAVLHLDCGVFASCVVRLQDTVVMTVRLNKVEVESEGEVQSDKNEYVEVALSGLNRPRGKLVYFVQQKITLHRRTTA